MIEVECLGAGQDVGRSCVIVCMAGKRVMFDCGVHMGYRDHRRFPAFHRIERIGRQEELATTPTPTPTTSTAATDAAAAAATASKVELADAHAASVAACTVDAIVISHFHLDHVGALPLYTESMLRGTRVPPLYMTYPTKAIAPVLLKDLIRIHRASGGGGSGSGGSGSGGRRDDEPGGDDDDADRAAAAALPMFNEAAVVACFARAIAVNIHETVAIDDDLRLTAYYAGHVLGAAMFALRSLRTGECVVYTGDYNMTPDRHLGAASIDCLRPSLLITESTYATVIRDSKRARERNFLRRVHTAVARGGKVLIPVFALGRAQELCMLIEEYWSRLGLRVPVYFSAGMTERANDYYRLFIAWTNEKLKRTHAERNMFDFKHIAPFDRHTMMTRDEPMVLFATPGMLHAGLSLDMFIRWAPDPRNLVIIPGYCVVGTTGARLLSGTRRVQINATTVVDVRCEVRSLSFSAHADAAAAAKGIMQLVQRVAPSHVALVHGERARMAYLKSKLEIDFGVPCAMPANHVRLLVDTSQTARVDVGVSSALLDAALGRKRTAGANEAPRDNEGVADRGRSSAGGEADAALVSSSSSAGVCLCTADEVTQAAEAAAAASGASTMLEFTSSVLVDAPKLAAAADAVAGAARAVARDAATATLDDVCRLLGGAPRCTLEYDATTSAPTAVCHGSLRVELDRDDASDAPVGAADDGAGQLLRLRWTLSDNDAAEALLDAMERADCIGS